MNHSDQACLGRSHETTVTLHTEETLLSSADYSSGDRPLLVLGNPLCIAGSSALFFIVLSNVYHRIPCCIRTTITDWLFYLTYLYDIM